MLTSGRSCQNGIGIALIPMSLQAFTNVCAPLSILLRASISQKVTYLFCDELNIVSKELRSRVRQATKDVVKSEV